MIKAAPAPERVGAVKPATVNINLAPAILVINTPAPAPATPAAPAPPAAENIPLVPAPAAMNGKMVPAKNKFSTERKVSCIIATVRLLASKLAV